MAIMTSRQAAELDYALERNGWTAEDVKKASARDTLTVLRRVMNGEIELQEWQFPAQVRVHLGGCLRGVLVKELEFEGGPVLAEARDIARKNKLAMSSESDIDLAAPTVRELGFTKPARFDDICAHGRELGLELAPQDAALYAALQAGEQVGRNEILVFAMRSITASSSGRRRVFDLKRPPHGGGFGGLVVDASFGDADQLDPEWRVVFRKDSEFCPPVS